MLRGSGSVWGDPSFLSSSLCLHINLKWFICEITLGSNSWLYKIFIYPRKQFKVGKGLLTSLFLFCFFPFFTNWFSNYGLICDDYVCLLARKARGRARCHRLSKASLCQLFLLLGSSCFIWLPAHLNAMIYFSRAHVHISLCHSLSVTPHQDYSSPAINNEWLQWGIMINSRPVTMDETRRPNCIFCLERQNVYPQIMVWVGYSSGIIH